PPDSVRAAARAGLASGPAFLQVQFSLACRGEERDLARLHFETGVPVLASSPLGGGLLTGKYLGAARPEGRRKNPAGAFPSLDEERLRPELEALARRARAAGSSCARLALAWTLERDWVSSAVCGARTPVQWMELLEAGS
ncbi:MAG: aldo/keto reductase, partial [Elusimicrobiota bacterium]